MGKSDTPLCTFCRIEEEDIERLFRECHITASSLLDSQQLCFGLFYLKGISSLASAPLTSTQ